MDSTARDDTDNALLHQRPRLGECVNQVFVWRPCKVACLPLSPRNAARLLGATTLSICRRESKTQKATARRKHGCCLVPLRCHTQTHTNTHCQSWPGLCETAVHFLTFFSTLVCMWREHCLQAALQALFASSAQLFLHWLNHLGWCPRLRRVWSTALLAR